MNKDTQGKAWPSLSQRLLQENSCQFGKKLGGDNYFIETVTSEEMAFKLGIKQPENFLSNCRGRKSRQGIDSKRKGPDASQDLLCLIIKKETNSDEVVEDRAGEALIGHGSEATEILQGTREHNLKE